MSSIETDRPITLSTFQDIAHGDGHDYDFDPHVRHASIRGPLVDTIRATVLAQGGAGEPVQVLEIGAGHGAFTDHVVALGAEVVVTEMSRASAEVLRRRYVNNDRVNVQFDRDGDLGSLGDQQFDVVMCVAVLHHIPDYLDALDTMLGRVRPGGAFLSFQDPLWYPRRSRSTWAVNRAAFYSWRLTQGDLIEGAKSFRRRLRHRMDDANPRDVVEYHVLRQGCDEKAIAERLRSYFDHVDVTPYWSTPARGWQRVGERMRLVSDFGVVATGRLPAGKTG